MYTHFAFIVLDSIYTPQVARGLICCDGYKLIDVSLLFMILNSIDAFPVKGESVVRLYMVHLAWN